MSETRQTTEMIGPDEFVFDTTHPLYRIHTDLHKFLEEASTANPPRGKSWRDKYDPKHLEKGREMLSWDMERIALLLEARLERAAALTRKAHRTSYTYPLPQPLSEEDARHERLSKLSVWLSVLLESVLNLKLPWNEAIAAALANTSLQAGALSKVWEVTTEMLTSNQVVVAGNEALRSKVPLLIQHIKSQGGRDARSQRLITSLSSLLQDKPAVVLQAGEPWADQALLDIADSGAELSTMWRDLVKLCSTATTANASAKWLKEARMIFDSNPALEARFVDVVPSWFARVAEARTSETTWGGQQTRAGAFFITATNKDILCGLAWTCGMLKALRISSALFELVLGGYKKFRGVGCIAPRVASSAIAALGMMGTEDALGRLAMLRTKVRLPPAQAAIDKAIENLAKRLGVEKDSIEEMTVPTYGLTEPGKLMETFGDYTAELTVINSRSTHLAWKDAGGNSQKSPPTLVKQEYAEELKELLAAKKDIEKMLPAQSERLNNLYLQHKSWPLALWRERYLDHPLVGVLARRLIWSFTTNGVTTPGMWFNGQIVDRFANDLSLDGNTVVELWHPLDQALEVVLGWRAFLEERQIMQPFKQAHREVYLPTPAEEETRTYSNRFATHFLRQHQFHALCLARGWRNRIRDMVEPEPPAPTRWISAWRLRAEFWVEGAGEDPDHHAIDGRTYLCVVTDQVRFYREDGHPGRRAGQQSGAASEPLPFVEVPKIVFSEIMRDVDLFVGISSIGNDPAWLEVPERQNTTADYWHDFSFGDLSATAQTRKAIFERLVPKLKIAKQCSFADKFLVVQGRRHAYKIHLGSGNVLIAPQDKYLCIVPAQVQVDKAGEKLFLPFEGDRVLSVILSKAFLLAADDKITDATILRQLS